MTDYVGRQVPSSSPLRIGVTGGTGFVGSSVLRALRHAPLHGHLRSLTRGLEPIGLAGVESISGDLTSQASLARFVKGCAVLVHCASYIGADPAMAERVNVEGTTALVHEARSSGVQHIVYVSTAGVYGRGPFTNARHEHLPLAPTSPTSRSRRQAEQIILAAGGTVLRPFLVYGAGDWWVGPRLAQLKFHLGDEAREHRARLSMIDVRRLGELAAAAALSQKSIPGGRVYDCNHPEPVVAAQCLDLFTRLSDPPHDVPSAGAVKSSTRGVEAPLAHDYAMIAVDHWFDSQRVWTELQVSPGPPFAVALQDHAGWYRRRLTCASC